MIQPTIGRVVLYYGPGEYVKKCQPRPALVCYVHNDTMINVGGFDRNGVPFQATSVKLIQDDAEERPDYGHAEWMPYQKGQAAKTEALEQKLTETKK